MTLVCGVTPEKPWDLLDICFHFEVFQSMMLEGEKKWTLYWVKEKTVEEVTFAIQNGASSLVGWMMTMEFGRMRGGM